MANVGGFDFVAEVSKFINKTPYVYGGTTPSGFDCSGLVMYALQQLGIKNVPRTSEAQWAWVTPIKQADLQPGDLVFSQWPGDDTSPGHVAVYAGNGQLIEAPHPGEDVHQIPLNSGYLPYVTGYGRVPGIANATPSSTPTTDQGGPSTSSVLGDITGLSDVAQSITAVFEPFVKIFNDFNNALTVGMHAIVWIVNPMNWVRIVAGVVGGVSVIAGAVLVATSA